MAQTLYQRLGGEAQIAAIIEDAIDRFAVDPVLAPRVRGKDLTRLKHLGVHFFCAGWGGPQTYEGLDLRPLQHGMSEPELNAVVEAVVAALDEGAVPAPEVDEIVGILYSLRSETLKAERRAA